MSKFILFALVPTVLLGIELLPFSGRVEAVEIVQTFPEVRRPILNVGSQGEAVLELQAVLKLMGYYAGPVDGVYTQSTAIAVEHFQRDAGLNPDGVVGPNTWDRLLPPSPPTNRSSLDAFFPIAMTDPLLLKLSHS